MMGGGGRRNQLRQLFILKTPPWHLLTEVNPVYLSFIYNLDKTETQRSRSIPGTEEQLDLLITSRLLEAAKDLFLILFILRMTETVKQLSKERAGHHQCGKREGRGNSRHLFKLSVSG